MSSREPEAIIRQITADRRREPAPSEVAEGSVSQAEEWRAGDCECGESSHCPVHEPLAWISEYHRLTRGAIHAADDRARFDAALAALRADAPPTNSRNEPDDSPAPEAPTGEPPPELYLLTADGDFHVWYLADDGAVHAGDADLVPEALAEDAPTGWSVFAGERRTLTADDLAEETMEARGVWYPSNMGPGDVWWEGSLRPATAGEVLAFFDIAPGALPTPPAVAGEPE